MTGVFDDPVGYLRQLLLMAPAILIAVTVHELAHGLVADRLGDPTARLNLIGGPMVRNLPAVG